MRDVRQFDTGESISLPQTDGATYPAFSPDSSQLAFFKSGKLYKLAIDARVMTALADVPEGTGINWGVEDTIVYTRGGLRGGLFRIASGGGTPVAVSAPDPKAGEKDYLSPILLPDGATAIYVVRTASSGFALSLAAARVIGASRILWRTECLQHL